MDEQTIMDEEAVHKTVMMQVNAAAREIQKDRGCKWQEAYNAGIDTVGRDVWRNACGFFGRQSRFIQKVREDVDDDIPSVFDDDGESTDAAIGMALRFHYGSKKSGTKAIYRALARTFGFVPSDAMMRMILGEYAYSAIRSQMKISEGMLFSKTDHGFTVTIPEPDNTEEKQALENDLAELAVRIDQIKRRLDNLT